MFAGTAAKGRLHFTGIRSVRSATEMIFWGRMKTER